MIRSRNTHTVRLSSMRMQARSSKFHICNMYGSTKRFIPFGILCFATKITLNYVLFTDAEHKIIDVYYIFYTASIFITYYIPNTVFVYCVILVSMVGCVLWLYLSLDIFCTISKTYKRPNTVFVYCLSLFASSWCHCLFLDVFYTVCTTHYENTPIQTYRKFHLQKLKIFR